MNFESLQKAIEHNSKRINSPKTTAEEFGEIRREIKSVFPRLQLVEAAVGVIRNELGEKLLVRRTLEDRSYPGQWCFPGGRRDRLENGNKEPTTATVIREIKEETGLQTEVVLSIGSRRLAHPIRGRIYIVHCYLLKVLGDRSEIILSSEHSDWKYCSKIEELGNIGHITRELLYWDDNKES